MKTAVAHFGEPLHLESGRILSEFDLAYETYGELNSDKSNVIVVCHALTGSHHAASRYDGDSKPGWWDGIIGDGKCIDTRENFVICVNILGSSFGSTNPLSIEPSTGEQYRLRFPVLAVSDVVRAQIRLFKRLGIERVKAVIGGSLGGMQALCFAIEHPEFAQNIVILASTYATPPWAIAFNKIAIEGIRNDPEFKGGYYDENEISQNGLIGMALGRMAGHVSFLSPHSMERKFSRNYVQTDGVYELFGRYEVERYLEYNGYNFPKRFDPLSYLYVVKMMNNFDATRHYGTLANALAPIKANVSLIAFSGDVLFPPKLMREIYDVLVNSGRANQTHYICIDSDYGHDAFLVEIDKIQSHVKKAIEWKK